VREVDYLIVGQGLAGALLACLLQMNRKRVLVIDNGHRTAASLSAAGIMNPITGAEYRVRIDIPDGFEYSLAEMGRGWNTVTRPMAFKLADSYAQFAHVNLCQSGIVK